MYKKFLKATIRITLFLLASSLIPVAFAAGPDLIAIGTISATYEDFVDQHRPAPWKIEFPGTGLAEWAPGLRTWAAILSSRFPIADPMRTVRALSRRHRVVHQSLSHPSHEFSPSDAGFGAPVQF